MAHQCRMPVAAAMALTLAAAIATVQEHNWWPTPAWLADFGADTGSSAAGLRGAESVRNVGHSPARGPMTRGITKLQAPADAVAADGDRASTLAWPHATATGGRALRGGDDGPDFDVSDQPLTATGLRLLGPPVRFRASRTPE